MPFGTDDSNVDRYVGGRLREARKSAMRSVTELACVVGLKEEEYLLIEAGDRRIEPLQLSDLAMQLGKDLSWFFDGISAHVGTAPASPGTLVDLARERRLRLQRG